MVLKMICHICRICTQYPEKKKEKKIKIRDFEIYVMLFSTKDGFVEFQSRIYCAKENIRDKLELKRFLFFLLTYLMTRFIMKCQPRLTFISSMTNPTFIWMRINFFHVMTICQVFLQTARRWQMLLTHWTN